MFMINSKGLAPFVEEATGTRQILLQVKRIESPLRRYLQFDGHELDSRDAARMKYIKIQTLTQLAEYDKEGN